MKGWAVLRHSLRQVTGNLPLLLRLSLLPLLLQALVLWLLSMAGAAGSDLAVVMRPLVVIATLLWLAVSFHRFILLGEYPEGLIPKPRRGVMLSYGLRVLGIAVLAWFLLIAMLILVATLFSFRTEDGALTVPSFFADTLIAVPVLAVALRLGTALPGVALERPADFAAGWRVTRGSFSDIVVLSLLTVLLISALQLIGTEAFSAWPLLWFLWRLVMGWFLAMLGFSILTTLYGHHIEGRRLV